MATVVSIAGNPTAVRRGPAVVLSSTLAMGSAASPLAKVSQNEERWRVHLDGIRRGNSEASARLYDETCNILYGIALRVLNDPADADEVVLDVYQQVWKSPHTFDASRGTVWGWLTMMTRSQIGRAHV